MRSHLTRTALAALAATSVLMAGLALPAAAAADLPAPAAEPPAEFLRALAARVDPAEQRATIQTLVGFGTRHTMSDTQSPTRGIGAARRWVQARFAQIAADCGQCLQIITPAQTFTGPRLPQPTEVVNVLAVQRGSTDPGRVLLITGHLDSRVTDILDAVHDAPGANDDASGVAAVIEAARVLSRHRFPATIVYGVLSGEEQGLYGGQILAAHAKAQGWRVEAQLNNDIIGNTHGSDGVHDSGTVRVFSEGTKAVETPEQARRRRYNGGEVDSPSRNLSRFIARLAEQQMPDLRVEMVYRTDRFGRGGDQVPLLEAGYPAVRVTEAHEHYDRQHQDLRTVGDVHYGDTLEGVDFPYLANVTRLNVMSLAALARAPAPPVAVSIEGAVTPDTTLRWQAREDGARVRAWWRRTTEPQWRVWRDAPAGASALTLKSVVIDDWFFGVSAVSADGFESPVVYPGDAGSF